MYTALLESTEQFKKMALTPSGVNAGQFISEDFKELMSLLEMGHTFIKAGHPPSNGKLERLHSALNYVSPKEVFEGKRAERLEERREKLHTAYSNRRAFWKNREACSSL
ncbi:MAG: hypothetical protein LBP76_06575 [Treponema sp.]|nr:hypothetical protein [Treponema sp.]